jgi:hypothetical protein
MSWYPFKDGEITRFHGSSMVTLKRAIDALLLDGVSFKGPVEMYATPAFVGNESCKRYEAGSGFGITDIRRFARVGFHEPELVLDDPFNSDTESESDAKSRVVVIRDLDLLVAVSGAEKALALIVEAKEWNTGPVIVLDSCPMLPGLAHHALYSVELSPGRVARPDTDQVFRVIRAVTRLAEDSAPSKRRAAALIGHPGGERGHRVPLASCNHPNFPEWANDEDVRP